jgi:hypothetical protein
VGDGIKDNAEGNSNLPAFSLSYGDCVGGERKIPMTRIWGRRTRANPRKGLDTHRYILEPSTPSFSIVKLLRTSFA